MATISVDTDLDNGTARTAGEAWTINDGATLTIKSDTRWHAGSPAAMTGTFGSLTLNDGERFIDGRDVRWMPFYDGTALGANVPAIGTNLTGDASGAGVLLGVWASLTSAPTAVGVAMPDTGFIKFRSISGSYITSEKVFNGATAIARATSPEVAGWIEVVGDSACLFTIPRLGKETIRGVPFYLDDATGVVGQVLQVPTNGGGLETVSPGCFVETAVGSDKYEIWPALACIRQAATYTWAGNFVTVTLAAHGYLVGQEVTLNFTTGGAVGSSGTFKILAFPTATTTGVFIVALAGSGAAGVVTICGAVKNN